MTGAGEQTLSVNIHPAAAVEEGAEIGDGTTIGPYSIIRKNVKIGERNTIGPHVVIEGHTTIGDDNQIFQFASIGAVPQDLKYKGEPSELRIGCRNIIREFVTLQLGTEGGGMISRMGDRNLFMANSHLGHDSKLGDGNVIANSCAIAGHVEIGNRVILGGLSGIHQFVKLGDLALISAGAMVSQDVPTFCMAHGDHARLIGINRIGMERAGYSRQDIMGIRKLFREIFLGSGMFRERLAACRVQNADFAPGLAMLDFISRSGRGIAHARIGPLQHERQAG